MRWKKFFVEGKYLVSQGAGKGRRHLEKEIIWSAEERKNRKKIFGEGKYLVSGGNGKGRKHLFFYCKELNTRPMCNWGRDVASEKEVLINSIMGATREINN